MVFPPRSKPDQWGETHCPFPVRLTYETTELNPAAALRDLELNIGGQVRRLMRALRCLAMSRSCASEYLDLSP